MTLDFLPTRLYDKLVAVSSSTLGVFTLTEFVLGLALIAMAAFAPRWGTGFYVYTATNQAKRLLDHSAPSLMVKTTRPVHSSGS